MDKVDKLEEDIEDGRHRLDRINIICRYCFALKWKEESKGFCCVNGQIQLASLAPAPSVLYKFLTDKDPISKEQFVNKIRAYNQVLAFTSVGTNLDKELANAKEGVYTYRIQRELYYFFFFFIIKVAYIAEGILLI